MDEPMFSGPARGPPGPGPRAARLVQISTEYVNVTATYDRLTLPSY